MQIELIGCTSAGKSTLAIEIAQIASKEEIKLSFGNDVLLKLIGANRVSNKSIIKILLNAISLIGCVLFSWNHINLIWFSNRVLKKARIPPQQRLNQLRKALKQLGRYEIISRRYANNEIIVVDEGTVHIAHNIFVHQASNLNFNDIQMFAEIVPLPDLIIYLETPEKILVERTLQRGHSRIENSHKHEKTASFVKNAVTTFQLLSQNKRIASRLLVVRDNQVIIHPKASDPLTQSFLRTLNEVLERNSTASD